MLAKGWILAVVITVASPSVVAPLVLAEGNATPPVYTTLADRRPAIVLPPYTPDDKQRIAEQAQLFLRDLYVNRLRKISYYGPVNDPVPGVADVVANARTMAEDTLHARLEYLFTSQHDLHLSYRYPEPFACYRSLLPFALAQAKDTSGNAVVAVKALAKDPAIWTVVPEAKRIAVGDILVSYDGLDAVSAAKAIVNSSGGANAFASLRRAYESLTYQSQRTHKLPANDLIRLAFKTRQGEDYTLELPWISKADLTCLGVVPAGGDLAPQGHVGQKTDGLDDYQIEFENTYKPHQRRAEEEAITDTAEPILHYDLLQNEYGSFGYIRLDSFVPVVLSGQEVVALVKHLLENELATTDGLIIDLRDNGGGDINFAESLVQLFTPSNIQAQGFRLLASNLNHDLFHSSTQLDPGFKEALDIAAVTGATYTASLPLSGAENTNGIGQAYFKPVAVLTNSSCYSSCDMMSASLQDHGAATIYGEDGSTGGGGANNVQHAFFLSNLPEGQTAPFAALPGKQTMGVAWRQTVRVGKHLGQLIEEVGISADKLATPSIGDFYTDGAFQIRIIAADLAQAAHQYHSWYKLATPGRKDVTVGAPVAFGLNVAATEAVEIRSGDTSLGYQAVHATGSNGGTNVDVVVPGTIAPLSLASVELIGYAAGERVWRGIQSYRVVPAATPLLDDARIALDFSTPDTAPLVVFTNGTDPFRGWTAQNGKLKAGLGDHYVDDVHSEAALFLDLAARTKPLTLSFDFEGKTEKDYDFFSVKALNADGQTELLKPISGDISAQHASYDLAAYLGKAVELRFTFTSDGGVTERGVNISHLVVE